MDILEKAEVAGLLSEVELMDARLVFLLSPDATETFVDLFLEKRPMFEYDAATEQLGCTVVGCRV